MVTVMTTIQAAAATMTPTTTDMDMTVAILPHLIPRRNRNLQHIMVIISVTVQCQLLSLHLDW